MGSFITSFFSRKKTHHQLKSNLEAQAQKHRTGSLKARKAAASPQELLHALVKSGVDYRGQLNFATQTLGRGAGASAKVDLAQVFLPGSPLVASVGGSLNLRGAKHRVLIVERQLDILWGRANPNSIALYAMKGGWGEIELKLEAEVGAKYEASSDVAGFDSVGFKAELSATATANAGYKGTYLRVSDPRPAYFPRSGGLTQLQTPVNALLTGAAFHNTGSKMPWDAKNYLSLWAHTGTAGAGIQAKAEFSMGAKEKRADGSDNSDKSTMGGKLEVKGPNIEGTLRGVFYRLQTQAENGFVCTQDTSITYKRVGGKFLEINAEFGVDMLGQIAEEKDDPNPSSESWELAEHEVSGASFEGDMGPDDQLSIGYSGSTTDILSHSAKTKAGNYKGSLGTGAKVSLGDVGRLSEKTAYTVIDSMSYRTGVMYWDKVDNTRMADGSGVVLGQSVLIKTLMSYFRAKDAESAPRGRARSGAVTSRDAVRGRTRRGAVTSRPEPPGAAKIKAIAEKLHVSVHNLCAFLDQHRYLVEDFDALLNAPKDKVPAGYAVNEGSFILEAAFGVKKLARTAQERLRQKRVKRSRKSSSSSKSSFFSRKKSGPRVESDAVDFRDDFEKVLDAGDGTYKDLQSIRLRYRMRDETESDQKFSLGLKFKVVSLGFELETIDRYASEGIVKLGERWYGEFSGSNDGGPPLPAGAVPDVVLF